MVPNGFERRRVEFLSFLFSAMIALSSLSSLATQMVTLAWQASPDPVVAGYTVHYGTASGQYTAKVSVTNTARVTISGLTEGLTYYFVVTAFTEAGLESIPSNEVVYTAPGVRLTIRRIQLSGFPNAFVISSTGVVPYSWVLEASEDYTTWRTMTRGVLSMVNVTVVTHNTPRLLFRLRSE